MKNFLTFLKENQDINQIVLDVPLFIRLLEYAREEVKDDETLHVLTENILKLHQSGVAILGMKNYKEILKK